MSSSLLFILLSLLALFPGVTFLAIPAKMTASSFAQPLNNEGIFIGRVFGAAYMGYAALLALTRGMADSPAGSAILEAYCLFQVLSFAVHLWALSRGILNKAGIPPLAINLVTAIACAVFLFRRMGA